MRSTQSFFFSFLCWIAQNRNLYEQNFYQLIKSSKNVCYITENGRNPFLVPYGCTHVWKYPLGKIFDCKRSFIGLTCDWLHELYCQMNWFCKPNRRPHKQKWDCSSGHSLILGDRHTEKQGPYLLLLPLTVQYLKNKSFSTYLELSSALGFWYDRKTILTFWLRHSNVYFLSWFSWSRVGVQFSKLEKE